jgi:hypothetical protein
MEPENTFGSANRGNPAKPIRARFCWVRRQGDPEFTGIVARTGYGLFQILKCLPLVRRNIADQLLIRANLVDVARHFRAGLATNENAPLAEDKSRVLNPEEDEKLSNRELFSTRVEVRSVWREQAGRTPRHRLADFRSASGRRGFHVHSA